MSAHAIHRVTGFRRVAPYTLEVEFADGTRQVIDFLPVLRGELLGPLREAGVFDRVRLDEEAGLLVWPNGADFDPETLRNWPRYREALAAMAATWSEAGVS